MYGKFRTEKPYLTSLYSWIEVKCMYIGGKYIAAAAYNLLLQVLPTIENVWEIFGEAISCLFIAGLKRFYSTALAFTRCNHAIKVIPGKKVDILIHI